MARLRVGDLLLLHERLEPWALEKALVDQKRSGQRLISFLISRAQLDADDGAMALSSQLGVPAALQRHLDVRDAAVITLIPPDIARRHAVFPIARGRDGRLVVAARDPSPDVQGLLEEVTRLSIVLAVTPAIQVERAVLSAYGELEVDSAELVDFDTDTPPTSAVHAEFADFDLGAAGNTPVPRRAKSISDVIGTIEVEQTVRAQTERTIELALDDIDRALSRGAAERHLLTYLSRFWRAALLLRIEGNEAVAYKEHGVAHRPLESIRLPLDTPSTLQLAFDSGATTTQRPLGQVQDRLATLLGTVSGAAALAVAGKIEALLVVGTPTDPTRNVTIELDQLADAMGGAYTRHRP